MSAVAYGPSDNGIVFLFDKAVVVFPVAACPGKGDLLISAITEQVSVDEFAAVVGIYPQQGKGQASSDVFKGLEDPLLGLILDRLSLGPACGDIRDIKGL